MQVDYLEGVSKLFAYYKSLAEKTFKQVADEDLFWVSNEDSNSIAIIVNHLAGNMLSRWTDFLHSDGEKPWRNRDTEFDNVINNRESLLHRWNEGWTCLFNSLNALSVDDLDKIVYIRNQGHTVCEAINRQLAHYPYHIGQIVVIGKMRCKKNWESLSIAKGNSQKYNGKKFANAKTQAHFTDEYLQDDNSR